MFILLLTYTAELAEIEPLMPAHMAWVEAHYHDGTFLISGRLVPRTGGVILARAASRDAVETLVAADPFTEAGVARYDVLEFMPSRTATGFENLLN
ncbi:MULTISPECIES: YciI family protein [Hymenobacter]|uniref:YCII-related domain-containing protein n=1 Tax=Hymenobacter jejuensis TaxID=2502781 RepID=A0A5B8A107_9BACT|nr:MULTISPECIES: YciI family protein [Hymenobacter]MBC6991488.1 hypothetical protein [Hymenobacter sp. BT491]QDA59822.1 hypothetical protein FHG12_06740 [Hymenobacter jejuensis]